MLSGFKNSHSNENQELQAGRRKSKLKMFKYHELLMAHHFKQHKSILLGIPALSELVAESRNRRDHRRQRENKKEERIIGR